MDRSIEVEIEQPTYTARELWLARGVCLAFAALVLGVSFVAWETGSGAWYWAFVALYFGMCALTTVVAQIPRRMQRKRDGEWAAKLHEMAIRDELTGLYNRRYFHAALARAIREAEAEGSTLGVVVIDLNDFKRINDTLGHAAGDLAIRIAAAALKAAAAGRVVARNGGDEFAVLLPGLTEGEGHTVAFAFEDAIESAPFVVEAGADVRLGGSAGLAFWVPGMDVEELLHAADEALYRAKEEHATRHERRRAG
ncbi:MAG: GGDEF domain-containing protein [Dehalococcoidia bacterium]